MKTLILFTSLTNNTRNIALNISKEFLDADLVEIKILNSIPKTHFLSAIKFGFMNFLKLKIKIEIGPFNINKYDIIIIGSPTWMNNIPWFFREFLATINFERKPLAFFYTYENTKVNMVKQFLSLSGGNTVLDILAVKNSIDSKKGLKDFTQGIKEKLSKYLHNSQIL